jgi:hypothetical protein
MYAYNISGGVANIFYQSCAQIRIMDEEIFGEDWKHLSKSKIWPKRKPTYIH